MGVAYALMSQEGFGLREQAQAGNDAAFESLVAPLVYPALRLAYSMLGDRWEAEDAVQEAIAKAWRKLNQLRPAMPVRPWFLAIVANQSRNVRRTRWFQTLRVGEVRRRPPEPNIEHLDLERAVERLPLNDRQAIFLYFYLDLPVEEVGAVMGISASAARGRIYRACRRLRPELTEVTI